MKTKQLFEEDVTEAFNRAVAALKDAERLQRSHMQQAGAAARHLRERQDTSAKEAEELERRTVAGREIFGKLEEEVQALQLQVDQLAIQKRQVDALSDIQQQLSEALEVQAEAQRREAEAQRRAAESLQFVSLFEQKLRKSLGGRAPPGVSVATPQRGADLNHRSGQTWDLAAPTANVAGSTASGRVLRPAHGMNLRG